MSAKDTLRKHIQDDVDALSAQAERLEAELGRIEAARCDNRRMVEELEEVRKMLFSFSELAKGAAPLSSYLCDSEGYCQSDTVVCCAETYTGKQESRKALGNQGFPGFGAGLGLLGTAPPLSGFRSPR